MDKQEIPEKQKNKRKKIIIGAIIFLCTLVVIYSGMALYFMNHFYFGSEINGISVSGKSVEKVKEQMISELMTYKLNLKERGGKSEQIGAAEIGLKYTPDGALDNFKDGQKPFKWISALFNPENSKMATGVSYDESLLKERVNKLSCFDTANIIEPQNPTFKYTDSGYVIVDEVNGSKVNKDILYTNVADAILKEKTEVDLEAIDCYVKPQYTSKSQMVMETRDMLNKYVSSKITYTFGEAKEIIDGSVISKWLTVDNNYQVAFDEGKLKDYIGAFSNNYVQTGAIKNFTTTSGKVINISGGDYDWMINTAKEVKDVSTAIKEGQTVTKEPAYVKNAYVEIDLTQQHLWFYKYGSLVTEGDIVSGNAGGELATPEGVYKLKYKKEDAILRGPGYAAPVNYWMPFNEGIGIHDATWRRAFGGQIYKGDGSHGCINCPLSLARTIYENIEVGTPIICYY